MQSGGLTGLRQDGRSIERGLGGGAGGFRVRNTQVTRRRWAVSGTWRHLGAVQAAGAGRGVGAAVRPRYPEGPCRVASPRASMRQCADAPPVVIVIRRPETVKRAGV